MKLKEVTDLLDKELDDDDDAKSIVKKTKQIQIQRSTIPMRQKLPELPELNEVVKQLVEQKKSEEKSEQKSEQKSEEKILKEIETNINKRDKSKQSEEMKRIITYIRYDEKGKENLGGIDFVKRQLNKIIKEDVLSLGHDFFINPCGKKEKNGTLINILDENNILYCNLNKNLKELENLIK